MLDGPLYPGPFGSCSVDGRGGLNSCLVLSRYLLDVENVVDSVVGSVVGSVVIYVVCNTYIYTVPLPRFRSQNICNCL